MTIESQLYLGDAVTGMRNLPSESVHLIIADPPYNIGYNYDVYDDRKSRDEYLQWSQEWIAACVSSLRSDGALWIAMADEYVAEIKGIAENCGLRLRGWIIWYYTFGVNCKKKFNRSHTHFLYLVKNERCHRFYPEEIRVPSARQRVYADRRAFSRGKVPDNTWILRPQDLPHGFLPLEDTWYFPRVAGTFKERVGFHGCQLPERLLARIIKSCSRPGGVVVDPVAGTGSTLVGAKKLGRKWVGWEISEAYHRHAVARLEHVNPADPLEGPADPLQSAPATVQGRSLNATSPIDEKGLISAFRRAHKGYSVDRVIADPVLGAAFFEECRRLGLAGRPVEWNWHLLRLRKTGRIAELKASQKTLVTRKHMDAYLDAAEIALRRMLDAGYSSLDAVLCDPMGATQFDEIASSLAPGFTAFEYRWAALHLRKEVANRTRLVRQATGLVRPLQQCDPIELNECDPSELSGSGIVYELLGDVEWPVYVGESAFAERRLSRLKERASYLDPLVVRRGPWLLKYASLDEQKQRQGLQSLLIQQSDPPPRLNYLELGAE